MRLKRHISNLVFNHCGLWRMHGSFFQKSARTLLDEVDLQHLRRTQPCPAFANRARLHEFVQSSVVGAQAIDYLEFGVFRGESIRMWAAANVQAESRFYGFDSFEGLPESWRGSQEKGHFDLAGRPPEMEDERVCLIKGWFDRTVPVFVRTYDPRNRIILHLDADLYSSTMVALLALAPFLLPGSLLIFDEFYDRDHEFRAFRDFVRITRKPYRVLGQTGNYGKLCAQLD